MYEEGNSGFIFKNILLKLLFIVVIIILIIWLFPTKNYVKNLIDQKLNTSKEVVFNNNINNMKDAAKSYFTLDRLPSKEGESKTITLKEMVDKKLLVDFKDANGKKCDYENSYATATKNKSNYSLKVNLACKDKSDYINSYIDDASEVYSKKKLADNSNKQTTNEEKKQEETNKQSTEETNKEEDNNTECQYVKASGGYYSNYGAWSNWTTTKIYSSNSRQVETKQDKVQTGTILEQDGTYKHTQNPKKVTITKNGTKTIVYVCPADFDNGGSYNNFVTCIKTMPNYVNKPTYRYVTYYRYRDRQYINSNNIYKWSSCNDNNLTKDGYKATGKTR